jgi:hypothetical protein
MKPFVPMTDAEIAREEAMDEFARELEKTWSNPRLTTEELKEVFPEILEIAPEKVRQLEFWIDQLQAHYAKDPLYGDSLEVMWERESREERLKGLKRQLMRFKRFVPDSRSYGLSEALIQEAVEFPIIDLVDAPRRSGKSYKVLCPIHDERTPSCNIYVETNKFWCFGCNQGGNTIDLIMMRDKVDFVTAVRQLTGAVNESPIS